jgi:3-dehydroquinate synthase
MSETTRIGVSGETSYDVLIGRSMLNDIRPILGPLAQKVLLIHPIGLQASADLLAET